ncbi:hypothetical protein TBLA_0H03880 [Henningerozyma blattae CBS 6284]|uniref:Nuclear protein localization protein 4 n=1 Tax=Henningerozyma blattae (strain ATCC 34711 / CBS 6284 / DSM 70876 / NBRC 10599 / NRRL Y-10934 / UCD 77-7) TaxID=1071380 RepID=I2H8G7_HENB6|nr:hypothetical protein TBLA_0H03880 [Tetrapisispora blattae CBS 6284]CCH62669.1 hypothetical protein TBLA_0H03880 [Tetrapisispora blattae CBS 6284]
MLLRFRSKHGTTRIQTAPQDSLSSVLEKFAAQMAQNSVALDSNSLVMGRSPQEKVSLDANHASQRIEQLGLSHGDMIYVDWEEKTNQSDMNSSGSVAINGQEFNNSSIKTGLQSPQSSLDNKLDKEDGLIPRTRSNLCKHGDKGMCEYCSPLPPWDREYHEKNNIKHISFHSYLKQLEKSTNKKQGSSYIAPLTQPNFKIDKHCTNGHEPWPKGICSKCQPSAITLQQQDFRLVDHVEFQSSQLVNDFIEAWRSTGMQRFGYMFGRYDRYDVTPLGVKAQVEAIYEPPQYDEQDGLTMEPEVVKEDMLHVNELAKQMNLECIGLIFTDLTDAANGDGSVFCKRHKDSFFLSSLEVIMAAKHQLSHKNYCKHSQQGYFSSRFVTCVVSGNLKGEIDIASYQVSTDAEALVEAEMISGSTHPSMAYINETTIERYVPEIFYMKKNEYNLTIKENAKPAFPVEYLLLSLTHGFPTEQTGTPNSTPGFSTYHGFPWPNRQAMGISQDYLELKKYIYPAATSGDYRVLHDKLSNFHFLLYVHSIQVLSSEEYSLLIKAAMERNPELWEEPLLQLLSTNGWQTLIMILQESM